MASIPTLVFGRRASRRLAALWYGRAPHGLAGVDAIVPADLALRPAHRLADAVAAIKAADGRLDPFATDDPGTDPRNVLSWSYRAHTPEAARLFRMLALHPGPDIDTPAVANLAGQAIASPQPALAELVGAHLLTEHASHRFAMHDLVHANTTCAERSRPVVNPLVFSARTSTASRLGWVEGWKWWATDPTASTRAAQDLASSAVTAPSCPSSHWRRTSSIHDQHAGILVRAVAVPGSGTTNRWASRVGPGAVNISAVCRSPAARGGPFTV